MRISDWSSDVCSSDLVVHGSNFMMAAMTLYLTMGRDAVVVAAKLAGHSNADPWPQAELVNFCGTLDRKYRNKYPRLTMNGRYADLLQEVITKGTITNALGTFGTFIGDLKDRGT